MSHPAIVRDFALLGERLHLHAEQARQDRLPEQAQVLSQLGQWCESLKVSQCTPQGWSKLRAQVENKIEKKQQVSAHRIVLIDMGRIAAGEPFDDEEVEVTPSRFASTRW